MWKLRDISHLSLGAEPYQEFDLSILAEHRER